MGFFIKPLLCYGLEETFSRLLKELRSHEDRGKRHFLSLAELSTRHPALTIDWLISAYIPQNPDVGQFEEGIDPASKTPVLAYITEEGVEFRYHAPYSQEFFDQFSHIMAIAIRCFEANLTKTSLLKIIQEQDHLLEKTLASRRPAYITYNEKVVGPYTNPVLIFLDTCRKFPERVALCDNQRSYTFAQLHHSVCAVVS